MKSFRVKILLLLVLLGGSYAAYETDLGISLRERFFNPSEQTFEVPEATTFEEISEAPEEVAPVVTPTEAEGSLEPVDLSTTALPLVEMKEIGLPASVNLAVPFTPQAPFADWDSVHQETCEEASLLMVHAYYDGQKAGLMDPGEVDEVLLSMVDVEVGLFGYFEDTTVAETSKLAAEFYGYLNMEIIEQPTVEQLKTHLAAGRPIIAPMAGRVLDNPNFTGDGPVYHMIVLKGYTDKGFITNDPGTRNGADWVYSYDHIMKSLHDWVVPEGVEDKPEDIPLSKKVVLVIYPM